MFSLEVIKRPTKSLCLLLVNDLLDFIHASQYNLWLRIASTSGHIQYVLIECCLFFGARDIVGRTIKHEADAVWLHLEPFAVSHDLLWE